MDVFTMFLVLCMATFALSKPDTFNVLQNGAVGDGKTDDSKAFLKTWEAVCGSTFQTAFLEIPKKTFLLKPVIFVGPCKPTNIHVQVEGTIIAPGNPSSWIESSSWLVFDRVDGLTIEGNGLIDGQGANWWKSCPDLSKCNRPNALRFNGCKNLQLHGLTLKNSQKNHISVLNCENVHFSNFHISSPEDSPNTDGIDLVASKNVQIRDSYIGSGDDCIAINEGCAYINITGVACGPGHGISVGSLGKYGGKESETVEEIYVNDCSFKASKNGARIKTWQGGLGYARKITFKNITLINVHNPIIIDQFYCPHTTCNNQISSVKISDISFIGVRGTSAQKEAIILNCSQSVGCTNIVLEHINIVSATAKESTYSTCHNAHGRFLDSFPKVDCLLK